MGMVQDKVALITGSGSGIGRATAIKFAEEGASVAVTDFNVEGGEETVQLIAEAGGRAIFIGANVAEPEDVKALVEKTVDAYGRLDCACNVAGIDGTPSSAEETPLETFDRTIAINQRGVFLCMQAEVEQMLKNGGGAIANVASVAGILGFPSQPYVASKHAVVGLTRAAALEYSKLGIRTNAVCPGVISTPMIQNGPPAEIVEMMVSAHPIGRMGEPEEVAELLLWLCSDRASFVTGSIIPVDGGYSTQ